MKAIALHFVRGSWALTYQALGRACAWCMAGEGSSKVWRALGVVIGVGTAYRLTGSSPIVAGGLYMAWLGLAWTQAPPLDTRAPSAEEPDEEEVEEMGEALGPAAEEDVAEPAPPPSNPLEPGAFLDRLRTLIGDRNGVLLRTVVADLHDAGVPAEWGVPEARALCTALGVPVKDSLKVAGKTSIGVHWTALPDPAAPLPPARSMEGDEAGSSEGSPPLTSDDYPATTTEPEPATGVATGIATSARRLFRR
ncbi:hypothetical protein ACFY97_13215 [Streptomyces klenkii]|uniref:hypothetical protein n=1 Tax=Streptomyces klenkii TaxID=1420899 RepID=UPI0036E91AED